MTKSIMNFTSGTAKMELYDEILKCYEGVTEQHANTSFELGLMNDTYWCLFRDHDMLEYASR